MAWLFTTKLKLQVSRNELDDVRFVLMKVPKEKNAFEKLKFTQCVLPKIMALLWEVSCRNYFLSASLHRSKHVSTGSKLPKLANVTASTSIYTVTPCETAHNTTCPVTGSWFLVKYTAVEFFKELCFPSADCRLRLKQPISPKLATRTKTIDMNE